MFNNAEMFLSGCEEGHEGPDRDPEGHLPGWTRAGEVWPQQGPRNRGCHPENRVRKPLPGQL